MVLIKIKNQLFLNVGPVSDLKLGDYWFSCVAGGVKCGNQISKRGLIMTTSLVFEIGS